MNISLGTIASAVGLDDLVSRLRRMMRDIELAFAKVPENVRQTYDVTLNFSAPGAVPGVTEQTVTIQGVEVGDAVLVGAPVAAPAGFIGPFAYVSTADTVKVVWPQLSGVAADPDGAGGMYRIVVWRH